MNNTRSPLSADKQEAPIRTMAPSFEPPFGPTSANIYPTLAQKKKGKESMAFIFRDGASHVRRRVSKVHQNAQCAYLSFMSSTRDHAHPEDGEMENLHKYFIVKFI